MVFFMVISREDIKNWQSSLMSSLRWRNDWLAGKILADGGQFVG